MKQSEFIQECIIETLALDHESYEILISCVKEACFDNFIEYDEKLFNKQLLELIHDGYIESCLYDTKLKKLINSTFDQAKVKEYWFCLTTNVGELK
jgi:hypothetical protein